MILSGLIHRLRRFLRRPALERLLFLPCWLLLGLSRMLILLLEFRRLAPWLGIAAGPHSQSPLLNQRQRHLALTIGRSIRWAAGHTPWDANCFAQAVTARMLLGLCGVPYALYFGLARDAGSSALQAHAWVAAGPIQVTGGAGFEHFTVVGCFLSPRLHRR